MEELVEKSKKGDNLAFSELIISMENELYKIARTRLRNEEDIKEAVQETIIKTYSSLKKLRNSKFFKTWIIRILINECNNVYTKNKKNNFEEYDENNKVLSYGNFKHIVRVNNEVCKDITGLIETAKKYYTERKGICKIIEE